jgi:hypothetical protein
MSDNKTEAEATGRTVLGCLLVTAFIAGFAGFIGFAFAVDWRVGVAAVGWSLARASAGALKEL